MKSKLQNKRKRKKYESVHSNKSCSESPYSEESLLDTVSHLHTSDGTKSDTDPRTKLDKERKSVAMGKKDTVLYFNAETVLVLIFTVFSIINSTSLLKLPKLYQSPSLQNTYPKYYSTSVPISTTDNWISWSRKVVSRMLSKVVNIAAMTRSQMQVTKQPIIQKIPNFISLVKNIKK